MIWFKESKKEDYSKNLFVGFQKYALILSAHVQENWKFWNVKILVYFTPFLFYSNAASFISLKFVNMDAEIVF